MRTKTIIPVLLTGLVLAGCGAQGSGNTQAAEGRTDNQTQTAQESVQEETAQETAAQEETVQEETAQEEAVQESTSVEIAQAEVPQTQSAQEETQTETVQSASAQEITKGGKYTYTGSISGTITVDSEDDVEIVLDNVTMEAQDVCIFAVNGDVTLTLNGHNVLRNTSTTARTYEDETIDAAIYAKDDLFITGSGSLETDSELHGIVCKDTLTVSADVTVDSAKTAIRGKDAVVVSGANLQLNAGTDGIKSDGEEGSVTISDSRITITSGDKGIQSAVNITVNSGDVTVNSTDDGIHSNGSITIGGGSFTVTSGDDAIHADDTIVINGGDMTLTAHECIEATTIQINDGTIVINATDDGINAARKVDGVTPSIEINGGSIAITMGEGDTDAIDSNGNLTITGGTIDITARSPFDYDGQGSFTGGTLIVNGQEVTTLTSQMGGGRGGFGGGFGGGGFTGDGTFQGGFGGKRGGRGN